MLLSSSTASADTLPFEIQSARGSNGLVLTLSSSAATRWSRVVRIVLAPDVTTPQSTDQLKISGVVESDDGDQAIVTASQAGEIELTAGASVEITLTAKLPRAGIYKGELLLVQGTRQRVVPLQITVTKPSPVVLPIASVGGTAVEVTGGSRAKVPLLVHNTGAESLDVEATVVTVTRVDKADSPTIRVTVPEAKTRQAARPIAAGSVESFDIDVSPIEDAGIYSVEAVFQHIPADGTYQPRSIAMTVYKRDGWWLAALFIAIGAGLAWFIRWFVSDGNDRLTVRRSFALLSEQVRTFRTGATHESILIAARALELDTADRDRELRWGGKVTEANAVLKRAQARFALLQEIAEAHGTLAKLSLANQKAARQILDAALVHVRVDPGNDTDLNNDRKSVTNLALRGTWREQLETQLAELREATAKQKPTAGADLLRDLLAIEKELDKVESLLVKDELEKAAKLIDAQRDALVTAGVRELRRHASQAPPVGIDTEAWAAISKELRDHADDAATGTSLVARLAALQAGQSRFFEAIANGLAAEASSKAEVTRSQVGLEAIAPALPLPPAWLPLMLSTVSTLKSDQPISADQLRANLTSYRWLTNVAVFVVAVATGIKVLYLDNPAWGGPPAYLLTFLWGAGIQVTGDAFSGIIGMRAKLGTGPAT